MSRFRLLLCVVLLAACGEDPGPAGTTGDDPTTTGETGDDVADVSDADAGDAGDDGAVVDADGTTDGEDVEVEAPDGPDPDGFEEVADPGPDPDDGAPPKECPPGCDDNRPCTENTCDDYGECLFPIVDDACLIANVCYQAGWAHAINACVVCDPSQSNTEWSVAENGAPCGDDDQCLEPGVCEDGQCEAALVVCNDFNDCTDDTCHPEVGCQYTENFDPCEDGNPCTQMDFCSQGDCVPSLIPLVCADDEPCTNDACGPDGCVFIPKAGGCSDGTECTVDDFCQQGTCHSGLPLLCDDGNVCTIDKCDPYLGCLYELVDSVCCVTGVSLCDDQNPCTTDDCNEAQGTCEYTANFAGCDDGDACTGPDTCQDEVCSGAPKTCDDSNACTADSCVDALGGCQHAPVDNPCDDDNACTENDGCLGGTCTGAPKSCNDGEACTQDSCDPLVGCVYVALEGECNDSNACTVGDTCTLSGCQGTPKDCGDGNVCTNDNCHPTAGCQYQAVGGPCDDGLDCSFGDACQTGQCVGDVSECGCLPEFSEVVTKLTKLNLGPDGHPGNGLDVDNDPTTCTPPGKCSGGIDNSLSGFAGLANPALDDGFSDGGIVLLLEHENFKNTGQLYQLNFYPGDDLKNDPCNVQTQVCNYEVDQAALDPDSCEPLIQFGNAKIKNGTDLTAGGVGYQFPLELPVTDDAVIPVIVSNARVEATVTVAGGFVTSLDGILAGAVPKQTFLDGIDAIDDKDLEGVGLDKMTLKTLVTAVVQNDIDLDGDGNPDAASISLLITGIQGHIIGVE